MAQEIGLKEADSQDASIKDGEAVIPLEEQKGDKEAMFNSSTVTIVMQLLPMGGDPKTAGRVGLLSIKSQLPSAKADGLHLTRRWMR